MSSSTWGVAMCRRCDVPLVATMLFRGAEFYCLDCGVRLGFLDPVGAPETPELLADVEARRLEFAELTSGVVVEGREYLLDDAGLAAHRAGLRRLYDRIRVTA